MTTSERAHKLVADMANNGATFTYKPAADSLPASFIYELQRGSDRWRCRGLIAEAKADAALWRAVVDEVRLRCAGAAHD